MGFRCGGGVEGRGVGYCLGPGLTWVKWLAGISPIQALALLEYDCGYPGTARELFREAARVAPAHAPVWTVRGGRGKGKESDVSMITKML